MANLEQEGEGASRHSKVLVSPDTRSSKEMVVLTL